LRILIHGINFSALLFAVEGGGWVFGGAV